MNNFFLLGFLLTIFGLGPNRLILVSCQISINQTINEECYYAEAYADLNSPDPLFFFQWFVLNGSSTAYDLGFVSLNGSGYVGVSPALTTNSFSDYYHIENEPEFLGQSAAPFKSRLIFDLQNSSIEQYQFRIRWSGNNFDTELKSRSVCEMNCINSPCYCGSQTQKLCSNDWENVLENGTCNLNNQGSIPCREVPSDITLELLSDDEIDQPIKVLCDYTEGYPVSNTSIHINFTTSDRENLEQEIKKGEFVTLSESLTEDYITAFMYCQARNSLTNENNFIVKSNEIVFNVTIPPNFKDSNTTFKVIDDNSTLVLEIICNPEPDDLELEYENGDDVTVLKIEHIFDNDLYQLNVNISPIKQWSKDDTGTYVLLLNYNSPPNTTELNFDIIVSEKNKNSQALSSGVIAGIVIGCVAGVALIGFIVYFFAFKPKKG